MDLSPIPIWNWRPHGFIYLSARPFAASGAFRMSELAASGAALESFSPPQQPRRSVGKVAVERERDAVATSPQKSLHSCSRSLPRDDAAQKEKLIRFAKSCYFKTIFQSRLHYNSSPNEPQCELMNIMNHEYIKGNSVCVEREVNLS